MKPAHELQITPEPIIMDGSLVTRFVEICKNLEEARKSLPTLTPKQFKKVRNGEAWFEGNTRDGITYHEQT